MAQQKAIFEQIFDGPDSIFGKIFGPSKFEIGTKQALTRIALALTPAQVKQVKSGKELRYHAGEFEIIIKAKP